MLMEDQEHIVNIDKQFFCYIIAHANTNTENRLPKQRTYNGYTVNVSRRLRQHNGEIKGGAKATRTTDGGWYYIAILTCRQWTAVRAMQHEWTIKYPTRHKPRPAEYQGPIGRIKSLKLVCSQIPCNEEVNIYVHDLYKNLLVEMNLPNHIYIRNISEIL